MSYHHSSIKSVIDKLNVSYFVPDIQRNYVWLQNPKTRKIEQLFDSLMRGYPIGVFLFWKLLKTDIETDSTSSNNPKAINFQLYEFIERYDIRYPYNKKILTTQLNENELNIVLDGQQRLTSLYIGLKGSRRLKRPYARTNNPEDYVEKYLFLNVLHRPTDNNPEDCYEFEFKTQDEADNNRIGECWFRISNVMNFSNRDDVRNYCRERSFPQEATDMVEDLWRVVVEDEDVINYFEEKEKSLDKVLRIFIRVNSGGMQLSYSDLLMSLLTATFTSDIREKMEEVIEKMVDDGFGCFGRDHILKTCLILSDINHTFKLENFSKSNIKKIENNWNSIIECLTKATGIIKQMGYSERLSQGYIIATICMYLFKKDQKDKFLYQKKISECDLNAIKEFVQIAQIRSYFTTSLDTKLTNIKNCISSCNDFASSLQEMKKLPDFDIDVKYLEWAVNGVKYGSPAAFPLLQLLYPNLNYKNGVFHIDHIYPKSKFSKNTNGLPDEYKGRANELWNLQLLDGMTNQIKQDCDPQKWIDNNIKTPAAKEKYIDENFIPQKMKLTWQNIESFESKRKKLLLDKLLELFGLFNSQP